MDLSPNFDLIEFACKCPGWCELSHTKVGSYRSMGDVPEGSRKIVEKLSKLCQSVLEVVRAKVGKPVTILSGFRCPRWNAKVGGVQRSRHMSGEASDIFIQGADLKSVFEWACANIKAVGGAEFYEVQRFIHLDIRAKAKPNDPPARWEGK